MLGSAASSHAGESDPDPSAACRFPDPATVSRLVVETLTTWAAHLRWDPSPREWNEALGEGTVVEILVAALVPEA